MYKKIQKNLMQLKRMSVYLSFFIMSISVCYAQGSEKSFSHPHPLKAKTNVALQTLYNSDSLLANKDVNDFENSATCQPQVLDCFERYNRFMFNVNEHLDIYFIKPIATLYKTIMPKPLAEGVTNFFNNLGEIPTIVNDLLQFNFYQMTNDIWRFGINSTIGVFGLFDIASRMNLSYYNNDFGLTLAKWGYRNSNYLVLPFFGSYTIRDGLIGLPVDYFALSVYPLISDQDIRFGLLALYAIDFRARGLQFQPVIEEVAIDKYIFVRNAAMQRRAFQIQENQKLSYQDRDKTNENK